MGTMDTLYDPLKAGSIDGTDKEPHDHAVIRAMQAEYYPNKLVEGDPKCTVFVGGLSPSTDEVSLRNFFEHYGKIVMCRLVRDVVTGFSKRYGFVEYSDKTSAMVAYNRAHKTTLDEREIFIDFECERNLPGWIPRRLGGGFGGQKESGQLRFGGRLRPFRKPIPVKTFEDHRNRERNRFSDSSSSRHRSRSRERNNYDNRDYDRLKQRSRSRESKRDRNRDRDDRRDRGSSRSRVKKYEDENVKSSRQKHKREKRSHSRETPDWDSRQHNQEQPKIKIEPTDY